MYRANEIVFPSGQTAHSLEVQQNFTVLICNVYMKPAISSCLDGVSVSQKLHLNNYCYFLTVTQKYMHTLAYFNCDVVIVKNLEPFPIVRTDEVYGLCDHGTKTIIVAPVKLDCNRPVRGALVIFTCTSEAKCQRKHIVNVIT